MTNFLTTTSNNAASLVVYDLYPESFENSNYYLRMGNTKSPDYVITTTPSSGYYTVDLSDFWYWDWYNNKRETHYHTHYHYESLKPQIKEFNKSLLQGDSMPRINLYFDTNTAEFCISAAICGIKKEDVKVTIKENYIIFDYKNEDKDGDNKEYLCKEMSQSSFNRKVRIPDTADTEKLRTEYADGVLKIFIPIRKDRYKELTF